MNIICQFTLRYPERSQKLLFEYLSGVCRLSIELYHVVPLVIIYDFDIKSIFVFKAKDDSVLAIYPDRIKAFKIS